MFAVWPAVAGGERSLLVARMNAYHEQILAMAMYHRYSRGLVYGKVLNAQSPPTKVLCSPRTIIGLVGSSTCSLLRIAMRTSLSEQARCCCIGFYGKPIVALGHALCIFVGIQGELNAQKSLPMPSPRCASKHVLRTGAPRGDECQLTQLLTTTRLVIRVSCIIE
jgi:hypothetical protein